MQGPTNVKILVRPFISVGPMLPGGEVGEAILPHQTLSVKSNYVQYGRKLLATNLCRHEVWFPGYH